jgi:PAS domain S-box-containing protein
VDFDGESGDGMSGEVNEHVEAFEREELVRALQARERFLTGVIGSLESFVTIDEDWRLTYANAATERLSGLGVDDLLGKDLRDLTPLPILGQTLPTLERAMEERVVAEVDTNDDKRDAVFHIRAYPLADGGLALYVSDVTARVRTEQARRESEQARAESEERYRQLFQAESDAVHLIDHESGRVLEANAAAETMYGYSAEEFAQLTDLDLSAEPELTLERTADAAPGQTVRVPLRWHRRKDGSVFPVEITGRLFDLQGRLVRIAAVRDVSERMEREEALRRSEEQYRTIVETAAEGILLGTPDGRFTFVNQRMADMLGYPAEELMGRSGMDFTYQGAEPSVFEARAELRTGDLVSGEWKAVRKDGSLLWTRYNASPVFDEQDRHIANLAMHTDITESKYAEAALRESEERLRHHLENTPLAVVEWDSAFVVTRWAGEAEAVFGWSAAETVGRPMMELGLIHPEDLPIVESTMAKLTDGKTTRAVTGNRNLTKDGRTIDCTWFNSVLMDDQNRMTSVMSLVQDNTDRRRTETALRESQESLTLALAVGGIATWDFRLDTGGVVWNREHFLMLGYEPGEVEPSYEAFAARVHPEDAASVELEFRRSLDEAADYQADFRVVWPDGEVRAISAVGHLEIDENGRPLRQYGVMLDVTERQEAERAARRAETEKAAQMERSRLARDLHDSVTQALFAASLKAEAIAESPELVAGAAQGAVEDVRRLNRGALAQMRTMLLELRGDRIADVPLQQLLRNLVEAAESRASTEVSLVIDGEPALPPHVHEAIYRVAQEALNNITRHARASGARVELTLRPASARLVVRDDGVGFDSATMDPSHIGLASMRERAAEIGARLTVTTEPGHGTLIQLDWPGPESR